MIFGFRLYIAGISFWLKNRALVRASFVPLIINLATVMSVMAFVVARVPDFAASILPNPTVWYWTIVYYGGVVVLGGIAIVTSFVVASLIANMVNLPFYDYLAEKSLGVQGALATQGHGLVFWMTRTGKNLLAMARKLVVIGFLSVCIFIFNLVPGLSLLVIPLGALILTSDLLDFSFDQFAMTFSERKKIMRENWLVISGFAVAVALASAIPVFNLIIMPGQVVAASYLVSFLRNGGRRGV